jgi:hypothetical protein
MPRPTVYLVRERAPIRRPWVARAVQLRSGRPQSVTPALTFFGSLSYGGLPLQPPHPIPPKTEDHVSANKAGSSFRGGGHTRGCLGLNPGSTSPTSDRSLRVNCSRPRATNSGASRCRGMPGRTRLV